MRLWISLLCLMMTLGQSISLACGDQEKLQEKHQEKHKVSHHKKSDHKTKVASHTHHSTVKSKYKLVTYYVKGKVKHKYIDVSHDDKLAEAVQKKHDFAGLPEDAAKPSDEADLKLGDDFPMADPTVTTQERVPTSENPPPPVIIE